MTKRRRWGAAVALLVAGSGLVSLLFCGGVFYVMFIGIEREVVAMPAFVIDVVDEDGQPVPGARVVIEHYTEPHHVREERLEHLAGDEGRVETERVMTTERAYPLCIHGILEHHQTVCVDHPGAMPVVLEVYAAEPAPVVVTVPLRRDPSGSHGCADDLHTMRLSARTPRNDIAASADGVVRASEP